MKPITGFRLGISNLHRQRDKVRVQLDSKTSNLDVDLTTFLIRILIAHITSTWSYVQWSFAAAQQVWQGLRSAKSGQVAL